MRGVGQWGWGYVRGGEKKKRKGKETYGCKERKVKRIKKSQLNVTIILLQYFIINFK